MTDPLAPGPIILQRPREDGSWENMPGWLSVGDNGNITLSVVDEKDQQIIDAIGGTWR